MPVRTFDRVDDNITVALGSLGFAFGPGTIAAIVRRAADSSALETVFKAGVSSVTAQYQLNLSTTNAIRLQVATTNISATGVDLLTADGWCLIAVTKATGTVVGRVHKYVFSTATWTHANTSGSAANSAAAATSARIGATHTPAAFFGGDIGILGVSNVVLDDAAIEALVASEAAWVAAGFVALWPTAEFGDAGTLQDTIGAADQTAITGTTVTATEIPWVAAPVALTPATETDTAQALGFTKVLSLTPATEADTALPLTYAKAAALVAATETDVAVPLVVHRTASLVAAQEADTAVALVTAKYVTLVPATEADEALALVPQVVAVLAPATETDTAVALVVDIPTLVAAVETDTAVALVVHKVVVLAVASEVDVALALSLTIAEWAIRSPLFDPGCTVDLVALVSANREKWAHEREVRRAGQPTRIVTFRPAQVPVASAVALSDGVARFASVPDGRYWIVGERGGVVRRVARTVVGGR